LNLRLGLALDRKDPGLSRGSLRLARRQKFKGWHIDCELLRARNLTRLIRSPKGEITTGEITTGEITRGEITSSQGGGRAHN